MKDGGNGIEARLAAEFREASQALDAVTAARLAAARHRAVAAAARPRLAPWLPALAATAAGLLAFAIWWRPGEGPVAPPPDAEAVEMFLDEPHELFEEDPDFYLWLDVVAVEG